MQNSEFHTVGINTIIAYQSVRIITGERKKYIRKLHRLAIINFTTIMVVKEN